MRCTEWLGFPCVWRSGVWSIGASLDNLSIGGPSAELEPILAPNCGSPANLAAPGPTPAHVQKSPHRFRRPAPRRAADFWSEAVARPRTWAGPRNEGVQGRDHRQVRAG